MGSRTHGYGADGGGAVQRVLAPLVAHAGRGRRGVVFQELAGEIEVGFGGEEVEGCLLFWGKGAGRLVRGGA